MGTGVLVGVYIGDQVGVGVWVCVRVDVGTGVGEVVLVGVYVGDRVGVRVGVKVGVGVGVITWVSVRILTTNASVIPLNDESPKAPAVAWKVIRRRETCQIDGPIGIKRQINHAGYTVQLIA